MGLHHIFPYDNCLFIPTENVKTAAVLWPDPYTFNNKLLIFPFNLACLANPNAFGPLIGMFKEN